MLSFFANNHLKMKPGHNQEHFPRLTKQGWVRPLLWAASCAICLETLRLGMLLRAARRCPQRLVCQVGVPGKIQGAQSDLSFK